MRKNQTIHQTIHQTLRRLAAMFAAVLLAFSAAGCGGAAPEKTSSAAAASAAETSSAPAASATETSSAAAPEMRTYTDDLGRTVEVPEQPERVAALIGSFADIWVLAGGRDSLAATAHDAWTSFDLDLGEQVADLGAVKEPSLEKLLASEPDLVIGSVSTGADVELLPALEEMGIPALYFDVDGFPDYLRMLKICTEITGRPENYEKYGAAVQQSIDGAIARQDGSAPSVLYIRASGASCKSKGSEGNVLGEMLSDLGCRNVADSDKSLLEDLSMEAILAADPDHIFIVYQGADPTEAEARLQGMLLSNPAWDTLTAVKEGRVHIMSHRLYNLKPNAKWGEAYEGAAEILYGGADDSRNE